MKVLLVNKFHYKRGGSETYYFALKEGLERAGHEVIHFAMKHEKNIPCAQEKYFVDNIDYVGKSSKLQQLKQAVKLIYSFEAKKKFEQLIKDERPDVVHMNLVHRQITLSIVDVCNKYKIPVVFTAHDLVCCCPAGSLLTSSREYCRRCYGGNYCNCIKNKCIKGSFSKSLAACIEATFYRIHRSYNKIDAFITPSGFYKKEIEKSGITKNPIYHMANFLPADTVYACTDSQKYFLFLGSLTKDKGVFTLLKAFHQAKLEGWKLVYAGRGPEFERMQDYIEEHQLEDIVNMLGFVTGEQLRKVTQSAYAVVLPSECNENGPYALMEPMASGKPVIGARIAGIPELAIPGRTGWLFETGNVVDLAEALKQVVKTDAEEYKKLSEGACEFAREHLSMEQYIKKLETIYLNLIGENK